MKKFIWMVAFTIMATLGFSSCERVDAGHEGKAKALTPAVLQQMWIEKWDGKLPTVTAGNQMIMDISKFK